MPCCAANVGIAAETCRPCRACVLQVLEECAVVSRVDSQFSIAIAMGQANNTATCSHHRAAAQWTAASGAAHELHLEHSHSPQSTLSSERTAALQVLWAVSLGAPQYIFVLCVV